MPSSDCQRPCAHCKCPVHFNAEEAGHLVGQVAPVSQLGRDSSCCDGSAARLEAAPSARILIAACACCSSSSETAADDLQPSAADR